MALPKHGDPWKYIGELETENHELIVSLERIVGPIRNEVVPLARKAVVSLLIKHQFGYSAKGYQAICDHIEQEKPPDSKTSRLECRIEKDCPFCDPALCPDKLEPQTPWLPHEPQRAHTHSSASGEPPFEKKEIEPQACIHCDRYELKAEVEILKESGAKIMQQCCDYGRRIIVAGDKLRKIHFLSSPVDEEPPRI